MTWKITFIFPFSRSSSGISLSSSYQQSAINICIVIHGQKFSSRGRLICLKEWIKTSSQNHSKEEKKRLFFFLHPNWFGTRRRHKEFNLNIDLCGVIFFAFVSWHLPFFSIERKIFHQIMICVREGFHQRMSDGKRAQETVARRKKTEITD